MPWAQISPLTHRLFAATIFRNGINVRINGDQFSVDYVLRNLAESYEEVFYRATMAACAPGQSMLDIGSHVGIFALGAAIRVGNSGRVVCFEPNPYAAAFVKKHIQFNKVARFVELVSAAVGTNSGTSDFYIQGWGTTASSSSEHVVRLSYLNSSEPVKEIRTKVWSLDNYCQETRLRPDVIKIDVEGAECAVLEGGRATLTSCRPKIFCEVHPAADQNNSAKLHGLASELGYEVRRITDPNEFEVYHVALVPKPAQNNSKG